MALLAVNTRTLVKRWGTRTPMPVRVADGHTLELRAHGEYTMRVAAPSTLATVCLGEQGIRHSRRLEQVLRDLIATRLGTELERLADGLDTMRERLGQITQRARYHLEDDFSRCGMELLDLSVHGIVLPDAPPATGNGNVGKLLTRMQVLTVAEHPSTCSTANGASANGASAADAGQPGDGTDRPDGTPAERLRACPHCDRPAPESARFCPSCGQLVGVEDR
jgi:membrane protease subunit (stomatin/prohibitin family)